jgi:hypothetical protein
VLQYVRRSTSMLDDYDMWGGGFSAWPDVVWRRSALQFLADMQLGQHDGVCLSVTAQLTRCVFGYLYFIYLVIVLFLSSGSRSFANRVAAQCAAIPGRHAPGPAGRRVLKRDGVADQVRLRFLYLVFLQYVRNSFASGAQRLAHLGDYICSISIASYAGAVLTLAACATLLLASLFCFCSQLANLDDCIRSVDAESNDLPTPTRPQGLPAKHWWYSMRGQVAGCAC